MKSNKITKELIQMNKLNRGFWSLIIGASLILTPVSFVDASDKYDLQKRGLVNTYGPADLQTYVYHTNNAMWMRFGVPFHSWDRHF